MAQDKVFTQGVESALDVIGELKAFLNTLLGTGLCSSWAVRCTI